MLKQIGIILWKCNLQHRLTCCTVLPYASQMPPCDLAIVPGVILSEQLVLGLRRNSSLTSKLNTAMLELTTQGYTAGASWAWKV